MKMADNYTSRSQNNLKLAVYAILALFAVLANSYPVSAQIYTQFNDTYNSISLDYAELGYTHNFFITLPYSNIVSATMKMSGVPYVNTSGVNVDVMLVTDTSGSMCQPNCAKLNDAKFADHLFVNTVDSDFVNIGLVEYSNCPGPNELEFLTNNKAVLNNTISSYVASGRTNIGKALKMAVDELSSERARDDAGKFIIMMTDGLPNQIPNPSNPNLCVQANNVSPIIYSLDMAQYAADKNITLYIIGLGADANMSLLENMASLTGGEAYYAPSGQELIELYSEIAAMISQAIYPEPIISGNITEQLVWLSNQSLNQNVTWNASDCGLQNAYCVNFVNWLQQMIDNCNQASCVVNFEVASASLGTIIFSDLFIQTTPRGSISCVPSPPEFVLTQGEELSVDISDVFSFSGETGTANSMEVNSSVNVSITPHLPDYFNASPEGLESPSTSWLRIRTDTGVVSALCPVVFNPVASGEITCKSPTPAYYVGSSAINIPLSEIFNIESGVGTPQNLYIVEANGVEISSDLPDGIIVEKDGLDGFETSQIRIRTRTGVNSDTCPINFVSTNFNCDASRCDEFIDDPEELIANDCTDGEIDVVNPTNKKIYQIYEDLIYVNHDINSFTAANPPSGDFIISPDSGTRSTLFNIDGSAVTHEDRGVGIISISFPGPSSDSVRACPILNRVNYNAPGLAGDIDTDLLVTGSRAVTGYYDENGEFIGKGPFIFTAKVWLRR